MWSKDRRAPPRILQAHDRNPVKRVNIIDFIKAGGNAAGHALQNWKGHHDAKVANYGLVSIARIEITAADPCDAPITVLADEQLRRPRAEFVHTCKRCAKSIAIGVDCNRSHHLRSLLGWAPWPVRVRE
jgi:hypothetical protein